MHKDHQQFSCIFCKGSQADVLYEACKDYYLESPYVVDYYRCGTCGLVQQFPVPEDIHSLYKEYPSHKPKSKFFSLVRRRLLSSAYYSTNKDASGRVLLDYGCGDGWFLDTCKNNNYELHGYEPNPAHAQELSRRLNLEISSDINALILKHQGRMDILTMHFVLEHLHNLQEAFLHASLLIRQGGLFFFTIPNFMSLERKLFGKKWHNLDPPRHISFPEESVVRALAEEWGFEIVARKFMAFPNGFAASLTVLLAGRFVPHLFFLMMPIGVLLSRMFPDGVQGYSLIKK